MSATGRGAVRVENDHYETPIEHARAVFDLLPKVPMLDPCCGRGNILRAAIESGCPSATGIEIDPSLGAVAESHGYPVLVGDALTNPWPVVPLVVMNPPYRGEGRRCLATEFIRKAVHHVRPLGGMVAALVRHSWIVPAARNDLIAEVGMPDENPMDRRPSFCMSVTCKSKQTLIETGKTCSWRGKFPVDHPRPKACPSCGSVKISIVTSDACEYTWLIWSTQGGPQLEGRIRRLHVPAPPKKPRAKALTA